MSSYSELIKNFERIRAYMREFYIYGIKSREDYKSKSTRTYDGSLICIGKGNEDWNFSAPHGAGRLMSRSAAFERLTMAEYEKEMAGIYSTCVVPDTLDESPMAYKNMDEIIENIEPTAEIICRIKPIYNFKAAE